MVFLLIFSTRVCKILLIPNFCYLLLTFTVPFTPILPTSKGVHSGTVYGPWPRGHFSPPLNDHGRRPAAGAANGRAARLGILGVQNLGEKMMKFPTCRKILLKSARTEGAWA